jgi:hypothetical protein
VETAIHFGVGYYAGPGLLHHRVVIPIHNERGQLVAYAGRSIDEAGPKYQLPAGFPKSRVLFNLHRARAESEQTVIRTDTQVQLVELPEQPQVLRALRPRLVVVARARQSEQFALLLDGQARMFGVDPSATLLKRAGQLFF